MFDERATAPLRRADVDACRARLRHGSRTFLAASHLLPVGVRVPACVLYAFCREADDAVDAATADVEGAVDALRCRLDAVYRGCPADSPTDRALTAVVQRFVIPRTLLDALLDGFLWDASGRQYETIDDLLDYGARVAGSVGGLMALLMDARQPQTLARACDLGVAMQLSNIARDVGEDARLGRLYLPRQWLREAGIDPDRWLSDPRFSPALGEVVARLLAVADRLYRRADAGIAALPAACRPGIRAARILYSAIGDEVARAGHDSVNSRAFVSAGRKLRLLASITSRADLTAAATALAEPPLAATRYLVTATLAVPSPRRGNSRLPGRWEERAIGLIDLFERLERRDRLAHGRRPQSHPATSRLTAGARWPQPRVGAPLALMARS